MNPMPELKPAVPLWPQQTVSIEAVSRSLAAGGRCGMVVLPTGTGKTGMVLSLARHLGASTLFLVNRDVLLAQTVRAARRFWPEAAITTIQAGTKDWDGPDVFTGRTPDLVVSMVPSLVNRLDAIAPDRFELVVCDEAHLAASRTWDRVLGHFTPRFLLGVTATPARHDRQSLARFGREPLYSYSLFQAIKDKRLAPIVIQSVKTDTDLDNLNDSGEDLAPGELARLISTPERNALVADAYIQHATGRRAIAFCVDRQHAGDLAQALVTRGVKAESVTGEMPTREKAEILERFARGDLAVLTSCEVLTTGFDDPGVSCLLMSRPTKSRTLFCQMAGRGLRLHEGKTDCLVLDFADISTKHKLVCAADLLGRTGAAQASRASPALNPLPGIKDEFRQGILGGVIGWRLQSACPWPEVPSLEGYAQAFAWQGEPASEAQVRYLAAFGLGVDGALTKGEASHLIDRCREYEASFPSPATPRQERFLRENNLWQDGMSKKQASQLITLAKGGAA